MNMDMSGSSSVPWLDQPVLLHSLRADTCKLTPARCEYRHGFWRYWYQTDHVYALGTIYFMCAIVGAFTLAHLFSQYAPQKLSKSRPSKQIRASVRYLSYRGLPNLRWAAWWTPSLGVSLLIGVGVIFFFAMTLGPKPYYWPNTKTVNFGSSPPIATRSGWMALGLLPFVLALSAKANLISAVTGVSYEKLQVFHHWTSYAMFVLALVHTFPFIVYHIWKSDMVEQWRTSLTYWTGVAALIPQAYLTIMSLPSIRNRYYEFFKATHIFVAIVFVVFFFIHCDFRLSSWDYFIATGVIYLFSVFYSWVRTYLFHGIHFATVSLLPCGFIEIRVPTATSWTPGQHVFIRFLALGVHSLTAHPFTISSAPHATEQCGHPSEMMFYVKPHDGLTARLAKLASAQPNVRVRIFLDGPYGGVNADTLARVDNLLVISGGSGAGFSLGIIEDALRRQHLHHNQRIQVVYASRHSAVAEWYHETIDSLFPPFPNESGEGKGRNLSVAIHITSDSTQQPSSPAQKNISVTGVGDAEKNLSNPGVTNAPSTLSNEVIHMHALTKSAQRPDLKTIIASWCSAANNNSNNLGTGGIDGSGKRNIGVVVCGPASMLNDVRNAVADEQLRLLQHFDTAGTEVYLHAEQFSW